MIGKLKIAANRISQIINNGCGFPRIRRFFGIKAGEKLSPLPNDCVKISDAVQIAQSDIFAKLAEESGCNREIFEDSLREIVNYGTDKTPEILASRMKYLQEEASQQRNFLRNVVFVGRKDPETAAFLIDNQKEINKILADKKLSGMPMRDLIEVLNKENYPKFLELAKNTELTGKDFAAPFIYGAKSHVVAFGNETVKVPSEAIVSLLSGVDSFSVMKTKSYDAFNEMVQRLVADGYKTGDPQYYQIAEGILTQKPELAKIADEYIKYSNSLQKAGIYNESEMIEELEGFFEYYRKYANLPQEIELKTIIPDENALNSTRMTLSVFKSKNGIK